MVQLREALKDQGTLARRDSLAPKEVGNLYFSSGNFVDNLSEEVSSLDNLGSEAGLTLCSVGLQADLQVNQAKIVVTPPGLSRPSY